MVDLHQRHGVRASYVLAVTCSFISSIFYIVGFVSPYWIVAEAGDNLGFLRLGLWEVCFKDFIFPEDYVSKAYQGCWYIYYPEYKYIRFWLNPPWLYAVQILSIIGIICSLSSLLFIILILCEVYGTREKRPKLTVIFLQTICLACIIVVIVTMGAMSKDREWMPRSDHNRLSWSFAFVVLSGFFSVFCLFGLVTHHLSVESRILMEDPSVREKLLGSDAKSTHLKSTSGFDIGPGTDSRLGGVPSLFTVPQTGSLFGPGSTFLAPGASSALSRGTVAPGAIGAAAQGTSAATVSAKLRQTLEAQKAAVLAANIKAADSGVTGTSNSALLYQQHARAEPMPSGSLHRQYQGSYSHLYPDVAMDSNV